MRQDQNENIFGIQRAKSLQNSWEKLKKSNCLVTAELQNKKNATFWPFSPSWGNWPICFIDSLLFEELSYFHFLVFQTISMAASFSSSRLLSVSMIWKECCEWLMIFFRDRQSFLREKNSKAKFHPLRILRLMSVSMPSWEKQLALSNIQYWPTTASTTGVTTTTLYRQSYHVMKNEHNGLKLYLFFLYALCACTRWPEKFVSI